MAVAALLVAGAGVPAIASPGTNPSPASSARPAHPVPPGGPVHPTPPARPTPPVAPVPPERPAPPAKARPLHVALGDSVPAGQESVPPAVDFETTAELWRVRVGVAGVNERED